MDIDEGGWTLVWQHTYMKFNPLHSNMYYFSFQITIGLVLKMLLMRIGVMFLTRLALTPLNS